MTSQSNHPRLHRQIVDDGSFVSRRLATDRKLEQGYLGQFFGASGHMAYYVALVCIILSCISMIVFALAGVGKDYGPYAVSLLTLGGGLIGGRVAK